MILANWRPIKEHLSSKNPLRSIFCWKTHPLRDVFPKIDLFRSIIVTRSDAFRKNWRRRRKLWKIRPLNKHSGLIRPFKENFSLQNQPFQEHFARPDPPIKEPLLLKTDPCFIIIPVPPSIKYPPRKTVKRWNHGNMKKFLVWWSLTNYYLR